MFKLIESKVNKQLQFQLSHDFLVKVVTCCIVKSLRFSCINWIFISINLCFSYTFHTALRFAVYLYGTKIFISKVSETNKRTIDKFVDLSLDQPVPICGDIKIVFFNKRSRIFRFWFNTYFVDTHQEGPKRYIMIIGK